MSTAEHLSRATLLFVLALDARKDGFLELADELALKAHRELDAAFPLPSQPAENADERTRPPSASG